MDVTVHTRELSRIVYDATEHYVEFIEKPQTQAGLLVFVPHSGSLDVEVRLKLATSRRAIRQINGCATYARCRCGRLPRVGHRWGPHDMPPGARE